jgi:hypothetical protein
MKKEITKNQQGLIDSIVDEFTKINKTYDKVGKKSALDVSDIVNDIKAKQKAVDENLVLKNMWTKAMFKQMDEDVKKLNKILKPIGFSVETHDQQEKRLGRPSQDYPQIIITHNTNTYSVNYDRYKSHFDIKYTILCDNSKRIDLSTPIGFGLILHGRHVDNIYVKTIEEGFAHPNLKGWIKTEYERATLVTY